MTDPESNVTIEIKVGIPPVTADTVTRRPFPEYGTEDWDDFMREISAKTKSATGQ